MEPIFNFAWALVAIASVVIWLHQGRRKAESKRASAVGLALLVVILFPVISVSDDLWSLQNPTESDSFHRRDHVDGSLHPQFVAASSLPETFGPELLFATWRVGVTQPVATSTVENPALGPVENRPPPAL